MAKRYKDHIQEKAVPRCKECQCTTFEIVRTDTHDFCSFTDAGIKYDTVRWQKVRCRNCSQIACLRSFLYKGDPVEGECVSDEADDDRPDPDSEPESITESE